MRCRRRPLADAYASPGDPGDHFGGPSLSAPARGGPLSCDATWLDRLPTPTAEVRPVVTTGAADGRVGARVTLWSPNTPTQWSAVLHRPEIADEWLPPVLGVGRAELLAPGVVYQTVDVSLFGGLVHFRRQTVVSVTWLADGASVRTCWVTADPAPWKNTVATWDNGVPWQPAGQAMGGWTVEPQRGGARVSYQVWAEDQTVVPGVQEWAMSRTLPEMIRAYAARVESMSAQSREATP